MTSSNPPYPYYDGIAYNSAFFTTNNGSGLTQAKANALYLQKTIADTAIAEETFSSGIKTDTIKPRTTAGGNLFNDATGNVISSFICPNNNSSSYGYNNSIVIVGESSKFMRIGGSMPSTSGNYILIGGANSQTTNIGIGSDGDVGLLSGTNKMVIGATTKTMTLNSSALTVNAPATFQNQMRLYGATNTYLQADDQTTPTSVIRLQTSPSNPSILLTGTAGTNSYTLTEIGTSTGLGFSICPNQNTGDLQIANGTRTGNILVGTKGALVFGTNKIVVGGVGNDTILRSDTITLNNPLTVAYTTPSLTSFSQIGYTVKVDVVFNRTFNATFTAFAPYASQLPLGVYIISYWVYIQTAIAGSEIRSDLVGSTSAITSGDTTGFTACANGAFPPSQYVLFNRQPIPIAGEFEKNLSGTVYITTNRYIAIGIQSATNTFTTGGVELQITRIG